MRHRMLGSSVVVCAWLLAGQALSGQAGSEPAATFDGERALTHVLALAAIGKRPAGSPASLKAAAYLKAQFAACGCQVSEQTFPMQAFDDRETKLAVLGPNARQIQASPVIYSPSAHLTAEVVAVPPPGLASDFRKVDLKGKIALVRRGELSNTRKTALAAQSGAVAVLLYNNEPDECISVNGGGPAPIPALWLSGRDGEALASELGRGPLTARLDSETSAQPGEGLNVVATRPGSSSEMLVFAAHYDSVPNRSLGADDNASGVAVVLELARLLVRSDRPETLVFIAFDGEEEGLLGSRAYVQQLSGPQRKAIKAVYNFDEVGAGDRPLTFTGRKALTRVALKAAAQRGIPTSSKAPEGSVGSDDDSFIEAGIPTLGWYREFPLFHSSQDTPDKVNPKLLEQSGILALDVLKP